MSNTVFAALTVAIISLVTILLRFLPFLIFRGNRETPKVVTYLGQVLPFAIMSMLVVFCLKGMSFAAPRYGLPEIIACTLVAVLHAWKHNTLLSILCGTVCYMLLIQLVFVA